jgi:hypothetical protein
VRLRPFFGNNVEPQRSGEAPSKALQPTAKSGARLSARIVIRGWRRHPALRDRQEARIGQGWDPVTRRLTGVVARRLTGCAAPWGAPMDRGATRGIDLRFVYCEGG